MGTGRERKRARCCVTCRRERLSYCCYVVYHDDGGLAFELLTKFLKQRVFDYTERLTRASFSKSGSAARAAMITQLIDGKKMSCQSFCDTLSQSFFKQKLFHRICWLQFL